MVSAAEGASGRQGYAANLAEGLDVLSLNQIVTFTKYVRIVLPADGYVFWARADLLSPTALMNASVFNTVTPNQFNAYPPVNKPANIITPAPVINAKGSLHLRSEKKQEEAESYSLNTIIFTSEVPVHQNFREIGPNVLYIGEFEGMRFAFSNITSFYRQAELWHYVGEAIYPYMQTQIIDDLSVFTPSLIVSNSLPFWLRLSQYTPTGPTYGFGNPYPLYPSMLVPQNMRPPYGTVHIKPDGTSALSSTPWLGKRYTHNQLCSDEIRIVFYGLNNDNAMNFVDCVNQYSRDYDLIGMMNTPVIRDEKDEQSELGVIAQKKSIEYEVSYYQHQSRDIARQLITEAFVNGFYESY